MIIDDEWEDPELNQKYLKEKDGTNFKVDKIIRGTVQDSQLISKHIATVCQEYMSYEEHHRLKADLVEYFWSMKGEKEAVETDEDDEDDGEEWNNKNKKQRKKRDGPSVFYYEDDSKL